MTASVRFVATWLACCTTAFAQSSPDRQIAAFNQRFTEATRHMDNAATMSLWAEDGVSLLPGQAAIVGKSAIGKFLDDVTAKISAYKVVSHDNEIHDIEVSGDWASEWANTTQVVQPPGDKPQMTIHGKTLLVLHRDRDGKWKIKEEAWTSGP